MDTNKLTFGEKIRSARKQKGLTQKELANMIGAKHNSVSDWEKNKNRPDPDTIELICGVLDITPNYLLSDKTDTDISPEEYEFIKKYRSLDDYGKESINIILNREVGRLNWGKTLRENHPQILENSFIYSFDNPDLMAAEEMVNYTADAAHSRTDIDIEDGTDTSEDGIMDEKDF